jgi:hypothetical protein
VLCRYRGLSSTGMTFKPSSYFSTSGSSYGDKDDGGSSVNAQKDDDGKELERESNRLVFCNCEHFRMCIALV